MPSAGRSGSIVGVVLAGGASTRMGGEPKALAMLGSRTLLEHARSRLAGQVAGLLVNVAGDLTLHAGTDAIRVTDAFEDRRGPLAGVLAAMEHVRGNGAYAFASHVASVPVDSPFFPLDLVERLAEAAGEERIAVARSGDRPQAVFGLWPLGLAPVLRTFLETSDHPKIMRFVAEHPHEMVTFPDARAFANVNTPAELEAARARLVARL